MGETHINLSRDNIDLKLAVLVVNDLDIDILAGIPFMSSNDVSVRPSKHQILIGDSSIVYYDTTPSDPQNHLCRTQTYVRSQKHPLSLARQLCRAYHTV